MNQTKNTLALLTALACTAACSSGSGSGQSALGGGGEASGAPDAGACYTPWSYKESVDRYAKQGSGTLVDRTTNETHQLKELTCMTIRDGRGNALSYAISFGDGTPDPERYLVVKTKAYDGDGEYSVDTYARWQVGTDWDSFPVTLTVSNGGKRGVLDDKEGNYAFEYDCDSADDTSASALAVPSEPPPGTAYVTTGGEEMYVIPDIDCYTDPVTDEFQVGLVEGVGTLDAVAFTFTLPKNTAGDQWGYFWFRYYNIAERRNTRGKFSMSCEEPIRGAYKEDSSPYDLITAQFTCPHRGAEQ